MLDRCLSRVLAAMLLPHFLLLLDITLLITITLLISLRIFGMDLSMVCTGSIPLSLADSTNLHDKIFHYSQLTAAVLFPISFILAPSAICVSSIYSQDDVIGSY